VREAFIDLGEKPLKNVGRRCASTAWRRTARPEPDRLCRASIPVSRLHVHVAKGGQAIVGNVSASPEGVGGRKKSENQPHAQLTYASGVAMPRQIEAERATVPSSGRARI
jgi:hypothetical protein